jgi:hypothetical protein
LSLISRKAGPLLNSLSRLSFSTASSIPIASSDWEYPQDCCKESQSHTKYPQD